jgi:dTDP-4-dehydrorhamnose reductase
VILVFGETGQLATELRAFKNVNTLGREQADLSKPLECREAILFNKPKAVINAAAYTAVDNAESDEYLARLINADAVAMMAATCAEINIPLVHISTDFVFDGAGTTPWLTSDIPKPINAYGRTKLLGERAIETSGCIYVILRTSWVISAHGHNFVKTMLRLSKTNHSLTIVNDQIGGPTFAGDIAHTCVSIAEELIKKPSKKGIYHYTGQPDVSWFQFAKKILDKTGAQTVITPIPTSDYTTPASRPLNSRLNCSTTKEIFGIPRPFWYNALENILKELEQKHDKT